MKYQLGIAFAVLLPFVASSDLQFGDCLQDQDNATVPSCHGWIDPVNKEPIFFPHQYNCSRFWVCDVLAVPCLKECAPSGTDEGLVFDENIPYPLGPVCRWAWEIECEHLPEECGKCEAWQDCVVLDDNSIICIPDCKLDVHCNGDEYCDWNEGGEGNCQKGCRANEPCGTKPCAKCENHVCNDPECCSDADCPANEICENGECRPECVTDNDCASNEYCNNGQCELGCRDDSGCTAMACSTCDDHKCHDPECCNDNDCLDSEYCSDNQSCEEGCNENSDCTNMVCSTCEMNSHSCNDPECCANDDCQGGWECENGECVPECLKDEDCNSNEYCDTVAGICKEGCRSDAGCSATACSTCENHQCVDPECCADADCVNVNGKPICSDENTCIPGCRNNEMCGGHDAICDISNTPYGDCEYCTVDDPNQVGECKPGCIDDDNCPGKITCTGEHTCIATGVSVIQDLHFETETCTSCSGSNMEQGLVAFLIGGTGTTGTATCRTNNLDNPEKNDYAVGGQAMFSEKEPLGACYQKNMLDTFAGGNVTWNGQGSWAPKDKRVYLQFTSASSFPRACNITTSPLSSGESADLVDCCIFNTIDNRCQ